MAHVFGTGAGFGGGYGDSGADNAPHSFEQPTSAPLPTPQPGLGFGASPGDCHYFLQGTCAKGDNCLFRHNHAAKANGILCRFWQNGFCKDAASCSFQHPVGAGRGHGRSGPGSRFATGRGMSGMRGAFSGGRGSSRIPTEAVDRSKQTCVFFVQGKCTKGDACQFSHATSPDNGPGQAFHKGIGPSSETERAGPPKEHVKPFAEQPLSAMEIIRNGNVAQQQKGSKFSVKGPEERVPAVRGSGVSSSSPKGMEIGSDPFSAGPPVMIGGDGKTYVVGPDGLVPLDDVMRTIAVTAKEHTRYTPSSASCNAATVEPCQQSTVDVKTDRAHDTGMSQSLPSQSLDKAPGKSGILTLPDGGFVTRKRAAEMQLLRNGGSGQDLRCVRQRDAEEKVNQQERRFGKADGRTVPQAVGKPSIMDRLGPAKQSTLASREKAVGPARIRPEISSQLGRNREEPRQQSAPVDRLRDGSRVNRPSPLSRPQTLGTARPTRRSDDASGLGTFGGKTAVARMVVNHKPASLDFKISTLDEIKSRKAMAGEAVTEATARKTAKMQEIKVANAVDHAVEVGSSHGIAAASSLSSVAGSTKEDVSEVAPAVPVPNDALQLEADDMIEFRQWL